MISPIYWHPLLYHHIMRILYGKHFLARYTALAVSINGTMSVHEVCAGDCYLYRHFLMGKPIPYSASDSNNAFVKFARHQGVQCTRINLLSEEIPVADIIIMQGSLYQFIPDQKFVIDKLLASARQQVIIAEPIVNLATSGNLLLRWIGRTGVNPGTGHTPHRFDEQLLDSFFTGVYPLRIVQAIKVAGGREKLFVLKAG